MVEMSKLKASLPPVQDTTTTLLPNFVNAPEVGLVATPEVVVPAAFLEVATTTDPTPEVTNPIPEAANPNPNPIPGAAIPNPIPEAADPNPLLGAAIPNPIPEAAIPNPIPRAAISNPIPEAAISNPILGAAIPNLIPEVIPNPIPGAAIPNRIPEPADPNPIPGPAISNPIPEAADPNPISGAAIPNPIPEEVIPNPIPGAAIPNPIPEAAIPNPITEPAQLRDIPQAVPNTGDNNETATASKTNPSRKFVFENIFVTVGTTEFDDLIKAMTSEEILQILSSFSCQQLKLQIGRGEYEPSITRYKNMAIEYFRFKEDLRSDVRWANLVIGHGGAGTILEATDLYKKCVIVVNESLSGNHQWELASKLQSMNYLRCCSCRDLAFTLITTDFDTLEPRPIDTFEKIGKLLDRAFFTRTGRIKWNFRDRKWNSKDFPDITFVPFNPFIRWWMMVKAWFCRLTNIVWDKIFGRVHND